MTNYQTAIKRINAAKTSLDIKRLNRSFANCYKYGFFTEKEFIKLDYKLLDRIDALLDAK
ncbi:MAG: hypothetical protein CMP00_04920 [Woeseiaceae bacterium]|nr:hypothetical protein [Woeseiaceae bacterium]|tara:strand:+ start:236 stop:415 length:180 start_codon:yes stop_codon:yes gene_type:complete